MRQGHDPLAGTQLEENVDIPFPGDLLTVSGFGIRAKFGSSVLLC